MIWLLLLIAMLMLVAAVLTLTVRSHIAALAALSVVSLGLSVLFVVLRAPDVAMTEAAVGAGLGGVITALAIRQLGLARLDASSSGGSQHDD